jgi:hypothetical protein
MHQGTVTEIESTHVRCGPNPLSAAPELLLTQPVVRLSSYISSSNCVYGPPGGAAYCVFVSTVVLLVCEVLMPLEAVTNGVKTTPSTDDNIDHLPERCLKRK